MLSSRAGGVVDADLIAQAGTKASIPASLLNFAKSKPLGAISAVVLIIVILVAIFAPFIAPYDPEKVAVTSKFASPGDGTVLGTDQLGRDVLSRVIHGARVSMYVGLLSVGIGVSAGTFLGIVSAYRGGMVDLVIQRLVDALMGFPPIIMALGLMAVLGADKNNVVIALVVILLPGATRVIRSQVLSIKELDYTLAARAIGASQTRVMARHILPNVMASFIVLSTITLGYAIVVEAALSFLGVGIPPDVASWGGMLTLGSQKYIHVQPWLVVFPGAAISLVVFSVNFLGDSLRDVLDPKLRGR